MASLEELLDDYARVRQLLDAAEGEEDEPSQPHAPASDEELKILEQRTGWPLPQSYRAFLRKHNGWEQFWGAMWIAGTGGATRRYVDDQLTRWKKYSNPKSQDHEDIEIEGKRYFVIGADDNGGFLALGDADASGERPVLDIPRGYVQNEWPSFLEFVRAQHKFRTHDLAELS